MKIASASSVDQLFGIIVELQSLMQFIYLTDWNYILINSKPILLFFIITLWLVAVNYFSMVYDNLFIIFIYHMQSVIMSKCVGWWHGGRVKYDNIGKTYRTDTVWSVETK